MTKIGEKIKDVFTPGHHHKHEGEEHTTTTTGAGTYGTEPLGTTTTGAYGEGTGAGYTTTTTTGPVETTAAGTEAVCGQERFTKVEDRPGMLQNGCFTVCVCVHHGLSIEEY